MLETADFPLILQQLQGCCSLPSLDFRFPQPMPRWGGVLGVDLAGGIEAVNFRIVFQIMIYWIFTVPAAAATCMIIFKILQLII